MPFVKGQSGNPKGRPPKGRALTDALEAALDSAYNGDKVAVKQALAEKLAQAVVTGALEFPSTKRTRKIKLNAAEWMSFVQFLYRHVDGPAREAEQSAESDGKPLTLPADLISPSFLEPYRDIINGRHTEYVFLGGRGSTKSSFVSLVLVALLVNNPTMHALVVRQVAGTLRESVYNQLVWAIGELGMTDQFKAITNPLEIEYKPTGQKIHFRGADDPGKIKSIKPKFGFMGLLWFEELDQFHGAEAIRKIEQSVIRGGDSAFIFKSFNPPQTANNWANQYIQIPKDTRFTHRSDYRAVPVEWLGRPFLDEAQHLQTVNPKAYEHEYLGVANGTGGQVFGNVIIRKITDEEIFGREEFGRMVGGFERVYHGLDFGFFPDPSHFVSCHYDPARLRLFIFREARRWKHSNRAMYDVVKAAGYKDEELLICDSAEPKSVADYASYGANARGATKRPDSVRYSMKWLQSLAEIVIDNERCPYTAEEFLKYEFETTKNGEVIGEYPDAENHAIDSVRYALSMVWLRAGK